MAEIQGVADVFQRGGLLFVGTASIYNAYFIKPGLWGGAVAGDWERFSTVLKVDDSDNHVGEALRQAFRGSRVDFGPYPGQPPPGGFVPVGLGDEELANAFGLKNARRLSTGLKSCIARWFEESIELIPMIRRRGMYFEGYPQAWRDQHPDIHLPFDSTDAELGRALKDCLSHCA